MKKCMLAGVALAIVVGFAVQANAQETIKAPAGATISKSEIQTSPTQRSGLFRRLGDRRDNAVTVVSPATTTTQVETTTPVNPAPMTITTAQANEGRTGVLARLRARLGR